MKTKNQLRIFEITLALSVTLAVATAQDSSGVSVATGSSTADRQSGANFGQRTPRYQLVAGDVFELTFEFSPEFNQVVTVQPDGFVTLRGIGDLQVASQTVPELTNSVQIAYQKILYNPAVAVNLKEFEKPYFIAGGQVARPGKYTLHGSTSLAEAVAMAGGFTDKAKHSQVLLFRRVSAEWAEARVLDVKKMFSDKSLREDPYLHSGDMLFVPQNRISKIALFLPTTGVSAYMSPTQF